MTAVAPRLALLLAVLLSAPCVAQYSIGPLVSDSTVRPGTETQIRFRVGNASREDATYKASLADLQITLQGKPEPADGPLPRGCSGWLSLTAPAGRLAAGETTELVCKTRVPRDANGSYSALLTVDIATARPAGPAGPGGSVRFTQRKVAVVLLNARGPGRAGANVAIASLELAVDDGSESGAPSPSRPLWSVRCRVGNSGNLHAMVDGEVSIRDVGASRVVRQVFDTGRGYVLAGTERVFEAGGQERLPDGVYAVTVGFRPRGMRVSVISASQTFCVAAGQVSQGEPSEALRREIEAARPQFLATPDSLYYEVSARARRSLQAQVFNLTDRQLFLVPHVLPWGHDAAGEVTFPQPESSPRFLPGAVAVTPARIAVPARGQKTVTITFAAPPDGEGEYYAAVVLAPEGEQLSTDSAVLSQRAILVAAASQGTLAPNASIAALDLRTVEGGAYQFDCSVSNVGNTRCGVMGEITVTNEGKSVDELEFGGEEITLLPGETRHFTIAWPRVLAPGRYQVAAAVEYADQKTATRGLRFEIR